MSEYKSGPVFFHPVSETKALNGFWEGVRGLVSADLDLDKAFDVSTLCPPHLLLDLYRWTEGGRDDFS